MLVPAGLGAGQKNPGKRLEHGWRTLLDAVSSDKRGPAFIE